MFLTSEDPRAAVQGSRDPLGVQPIWARFGREVVTNLTTVSRVVRGFTTLILARYLTERLIDDGRATEEDALGIFMRAEQAAAYAQYVKYREKDEARLRGVRRVRRFLDEYGNKPRIANDPSGFILSDQKTYGLWGLYSTSARVSGIVADGPVGLTDRSRHFVEAVYRPRLRQIERRLLDLVGRGGSIDTRTGREPFESFAKVLSPSFVTAEVSFYRDTLRDARFVERTAAAQRQAALASLMQAKLNSSTAIGRVAVSDLALAAEHSGENSLVDKLRRILRLEAMLAPAEALFDLVLMRHDQSLESIAEYILGEWGSRIPNLQEPIRPLLNDIEGASSAKQRQELERCDDALHRGDYTGALLAVVEINRVVMEGRKSAPWVRLSPDTGRIDVRYRGEDSRFPEGEDLATLWRNSYFLDALKDVTFQLGGHD